MGASLLSNAIDLFLQRETIEGRQRKREKKTDAAIEKKKRFAKGALDFCWSSSGDGSGIGNSPVRGHGLARPQWAGFLGGIVADRKDEVHLGSARPPEFIPTLAAQGVGRNVGCLQLLQSFGTNRSRGMTSGAVGGECRPSSVVENRFGHDGKIGRAS